MRIGCWAGAVAVLAMLGCAGTAKPDAKIDNASLSKLNEQQMAPVDAARIDEGRARDTQARAKANEAEAHSRLEIAKAEHDVATAQLNRAKAEHDLLVQQKPGKDDLARATDAFNVAQDRVRAVDLKQDYLTRMIAVAAKERELADRHVATAELLTERAKFLALKANAPNEVADMDAPHIEASLAQAQAAEANVRKQAAEMRAEAVDSYNKWSELDAKVRSASQTQAPVPPPSTAAQPVPQ